MPNVLDALKPPGSKIADGFSVAEGSWLVGDRFPDVQGYYASESIPGWEAVLIVGEQPLQVLQSYLRQAEATGFTDFYASVQAPTGPCVAETEPGETVDVNLARGQVDRLWCDVVAQRSAGPGRFDIVFLELHVGPTRDCDQQCRQSYASYVEIELWRAHPVPFPGTPTAESLDVAELPLPMLQRPAELRLPEPGEQVGADQIFFEGFEVEPGSEVLAPGAALNSGGTGNFTVLLRITGDPRSVIEAYGRQFERVCCPGSQFNLEEQMIEDATQLRGGVAESGGLSIEILTTPLEQNAPVFARVDVAND